MVKTAIVTIVGFCTRFASATIAVSILISVLAGYYAAIHFAINTDVGTLMSPDLPWRQREIDYDRALPSHDNSDIIVAVEAPTPELATIARAALADDLARNKDLFPAVTQPDASAFFVRNGLLFRSKEEVATITRHLGIAAPLIRVPVTDPSLRGLSQMIAYVLAGVREQELTLDNVAKPFDKAAATVEHLLAGEPATFSWMELIDGAPQGVARRVIDVKPTLDFRALEPGRRATDAIRAAADRLDLAGRYQARVRLTGLVPIANEEFATVKDGAIVNAAVTISLVLFILFLALRSFRLIVAVVISLFVSLSITAMVGLMLVGALNLISIAFAVLCVGLGVDFGIQFSVRYRQERFKEPDLDAALASAGARAGIPLTLAAAAVAAGFLSFLPTSYRGVSELGEIAGAGMIIAYLTSITVLPALIRVLRPPGEVADLGFGWLAPVDTFLERHRGPIIVATLVIAILGLPALGKLRFDFNPMNLRSPQVESIATYLDLRRDPNTRAELDAVNVLTPSIAAADAAARRLKALPQVGQVVTMATFVPADQPAKLAMIGEAVRLLDPVLHAPPRTAATDEDDVAALRRGTDNLTKAATGQNGPGAAAARRLAAALSQLAATDAGVRRRVADTFLVPLKSDLDDFRNLLQAVPVTLDTLPPEIVNDWRSAAGDIRVRASPKDDRDDNESLRSFARAVLAVEPEATGGPVSILLSGDTVVAAFIQAGGWALGAITVLLWVTLRRFGDVLLTLVPLVLAGVVTLEICYLIGLPLNFANIIALPLLLGVGVAFKIYYILSWRSGRTKLLQSSLTRAVIFSAATTATAFGSLWFSSHPGTSSMGKLLALSLCCTLLAAVLFQPALMGRPREVRDI